MQKQKHYKTDIINDKISTYHTCLIVLVKLYHFILSSEKRVTATPRYNPSVTTGATNHTLPEQGECLARILVISLRVQISVAGTVVSPSAHWVKG